MYAQADLRLCWSHIPYCWKSHVTAQILVRLPLNEQADLGLHNNVNLIKFILAEPESRAVAQWESVRLGIEGLLVGNSP